MDRGDIVAFRLDNATPTERWRCPMDAHVIDLAWSRDGRIAATLQRRGTGKANASVLDAANGDLMVPAVPLPDGTQGCAFLPDGRLVLGTGIWTADGSHCAVPFATGGGSAGTAQRVVVRDDRVLVHRNWGVQVYDLDGRQFWQMLRHGADFSQAASHMDVADDGTVLLSFGDGEIWQIDADGSRMQTWSEGSTVWSAHFAPDGQSVLCADWRGRVMVRHRGGQLLHRWQGHRLGTLCASIGDRAESLLTGSWNGHVKIWHPGRARSLPFRSGFARASLLALDDKLFVAGNDGQLLALDATGELIAQHKLPSGFFAMAPHIDGRTAWVVDMQDRRLWSWLPGNDPKEVAVPPGQRKTLIHTLILAQLESGKLLLSSGGHGLASKLLDPSTGAGSLPDMPSAAWCAAACNGRVVVTVDGWGELRVHDGNGKLLRTGREPGYDGIFTGRKAVASCIQVSADGRFAVVGREDGSVSYWELAALESGPVDRWVDHRQRVRNVAISADGGKVASITSSGHLVVREVGKAEPLLQWRSQVEPLESVVFFGADAVVTSGWRNSGVVR